MSSSQPNPLAAAICQLALELPTSVMDGLCARLELLPVDAGRSELGRVAGFLQTNSAKGRYHAVVEAWEALHVRPTAVGLAMALRAASATDDWHRRFQSLELVWSGPSPYNSGLRRTDQVLLEIIAVAQQELWIVSFAAYHVKLINDALLDAIRRGVQVSLVLESSEGGILSFDGIDAMDSNLLARSKVYVWPLNKREVDPNGRHGALHAKCAVADSNRMLISSANLTEAALERNIELGMFIKGGNQPGEVMKQLRWLVETQVLDQYVVGKGG